MVGILAQKSKMVGSKLTGHKNGGINMEYSNGTLGRALKYPPTNEVFFPGVVILCSLPVSYLHAHSIHCIFRVITLKAKVYIDLDFLNIVKVNLNTP